MLRNLNTNTVLIGGITSPVYGGIKREQEGEEENSHRAGSKPVGKLSHPFKRNYVRSNHYY